MFQKMKLFELYKILLPPGGSGKSYFCAFISGFVLIIIKECLFVVAIYSI
jgi:hypothetical protein